jgi:hypothetical protein
MVVIIKSLSSQLNLGLVHTANRRDMPTEVIYFIETAPQDSFGILGGHERYVCLRKYTLEFGVSGI